MKILKHSLPSLDFREDTDSFLLVDADAIPYEQGEKESVYQVRARRNISGLIGIDFNPGNSLRAVNNSQANQILGCFENIFPGIDVVLCMTSSNTTANRLWLTLHVVNRWNNTSYYGRFTEVELQSTQSLANSWGNCYPIQENGHYFFLVENFGATGKHLLVDIFPHDAIALTPGTIRITDAGYTRPFNNFVLRNAGDYGNQQVFVRNVVSYSNLVGYFTPNIPGVADLQSYEVNLNTALPITAGERVTMISYAASYLRSGMYYPISAMVSSLTLPAGDTSLRVPDELASFYHLKEKESAGFFVSTLPHFEQDTRAGLRVSQGVPDTEYHTSVSSPVSPVIPTTPTNNVFPKGFSFLQWLKPKSANTKFTLSRTRIVPPISGNLGVYAFTQAGHPHYRLGVSASNTQAFFSLPQGDRNVAGVITDSTNSCLNPLVGDFINMVSVSSGENDTPAVSQLVWIPFTTKGRTFVNAEGLNYITPVFGLKAPSVERFINFGGRLGAVIGGFLYISSPVRTNPEFPSFLDFQVRINPASPELNAEIYQLNLKEINSGCTTQVGYLVAGAEGVVSINKLTGIIDKVVDYPTLSVFPITGAYFVLGIGQYSILAYDDNNKQFIEVKHGRIHPELAEIITRNTFTVARNLGRKYIDPSNRVIAYDPKGLVVFLDKNNILNCHRFTARDFSFSGRYVLHVFGSSTPQNNWVHPFFGYIGNNLAGVNYDVVANTVTAAVTKGDVGVIDDLSVYAQPYNRIASVTAQLKQINAPFNVLETGNSRRIFDPMVITNLSTPEKAPVPILFDQKGVSVVHEGFSDSFSQPPYFNISMAVYQDKYATTRIHDSLVVSTPNNIDGAYSMPVRLCFNKRMFFIRFNGTIADIDSLVLKRQTRRKK